MSEVAENTGLVELPMSDDANYSDMSFPDMSTEGETSVEPEVVKAPEVTSTEATVESESSEAPPSNELDELFDQLLNPEEIREQQEGGASTTQEAVPTQEQLIQQATQQVSQQYDQRFQQMLQASNAEIQQQKTLNAQLQQQLAQIQGYFQAQQQYQQQQPQQPRTEQEEAMDTLTANVYDRVRQQVEQQYQPQIQSMQSQLQQYQQRQAEYARQQQTLQKRNDWLSQADSILNETVFKGVETVPPEVATNMRRMMARYEQYAGLSPVEAAPAAQRAILETAKFLLKAQAERTKSRQQTISQFPQKQPQGGSTYSTDGKSMAHVSDDASFKHAMDVSLGETGPTKSVEDGIPEFDLY